MNDPAPKELHPSIDETKKLELFELGCSLFDEGRFFDAHEPWEEIWRSDNPEPRDLFQGLVQVAAGLHIWHERSTAAAARRVIGRGLDRLRGASELQIGDTSVELDLEPLTALMELWLVWLDLDDEERGRSPPPLYPRFER